MTCKVIHTLRKPDKVIYAGIYVQDPIEGATDRHGHVLRSLYRPISLKDVPNKAISECIEDLIDKCPEIDTVEYVTPRGISVSILRGQDADSIFKALTEAGSYII